MYLYYCHHSCAGHPTEAGRCTAEQLSDNQAAQLALGLAAGPNSSTTKDNNMNDSTDRWDYGHTMDPETEDLIFGTELHEGMLVLLEDCHSFSFDGPGRLSKEESVPGEHDRLRKGLDEKARWCRITKLNQDPRWNTNDDGFGYGFNAKHRELTPLTRFIGVYEDGTKATRTYDGAYGWFVKKDSIPEWPDYTPDEEDLASVGSDRNN